MAVSMHPSCFKVNESRSGGSNRILTNTLHARVKLGTQRLGPTMEKSLWDLLLLFLLLPLLLLLLLLFLLLLLLLLLLLGGDADIRNG